LPFLLGAVIFAAAELCRAERGTPSAAAFASPPIVACGGHCDVAALGTLCQYLDPV